MHRHGKTSMHYTQQHAVATSAHTHRPPPSSTPDAERQCTYSHPSRAVANAAADRVAFLAGWPFVPYLGPLFIHTNSVSTLLSYLLKPHNNCTCYGLTRRRRAVHCTTTTTTQINKHREFPPATAPPPPEATSRVVSPACLRLSSRARPTDRSTRGRATTHSSSYISPADRPPTRLLAPPTTHHTTTQCCPSPPRC